MTDYGHDLKFGTFITPVSADPFKVVDLAVLSDHVGYDLVSFQDHPYQPALLDAWSLMAFIAARTERVHLAANVSNLPLRLPILLARSSTTIDLLSNGRLELGIGAGGFWDAIEAVGGERRTPGEAVTALDEAIQIIRQLWDADASGGAKFHGNSYSINGAKRGPRTPHKIGINVGAYKPKMLDLVGRSADGWIPSFGYLPNIEPLATMNSHIDAGAMRANRNPNEIRRWINIGFEQATVELMIKLALDYGISGFILSSDSEDEIVRFFGDRAEQLRKNVALARQG
ncbi:MAG: LLM class flavin-dependent oxidoreductase [Microbacteriaceae bacterium]|nr:LLM class flavin-dependent oxidoreductase [Microbacteriaceae bacterium]